MAAHPPIVCPPLSNTIVPPSGTGPTLAVRVTLSPATGAAGEGEPTVMSVLAATTVNEDGWLVLPVKAPSPE